MTTYKISMSIVVLLLFATSSIAVAAADCPATVGTDNEYVEGWPHVDTWIGSKELAIILPKDNTFLTTKPGHAISVKLFWYVAGLEPGREAGFEMTIRRLDEGLNDAVISEPTNAGGSSLGAWTILAGVDFPSEGCWEIAAKFEGASLAFIVKTVMPAHRRRDTA